MPFKEPYHTRITTIHEIEPGIVRVEIKGDIEVELEDLMEHWKVMKEHYNEKNKACFLSVFNPYTTISTEAREKFGDPDENLHKKAEAIVVKSLPHLMLAKFHTTFYKHNYPNKVFKDEESALEWLRQYR